MGICEIQFWDDPNHIIIKSSSSTDQSYKDFQSCLPNSSILSLTFSFVLARTHSLPICHSLLKERDVTYLGMEAVSLVMLLQCDAWCRVQMSEKNSPWLKMYDHVQNTHTCLVGKWSPRVDAVLTPSFVSSVTFPKVPKTHRQDRKDQEGLRTQSSVK